VNRTIWSSWIHRPWQRLEARPQKPLGSTIAEPFRAAESEPRGVLITSSCSHFVDRESFLEILKRAAAAAQRRVWILDVRGAAPDHPALMQCRRPPTSSA